MAEKGRRTDVVLTYQKKHVTRGLLPYLETVSYTDVATGGSDELSLGLYNQKLRFLTKFKPLKGAKLSAVIRMIGWEKSGVIKRFKCGAFVTDDLSASGTAGNFTLKAVSAPVNGDFQTTDRTKTYKKATVKSIAGKIAKRAKVKLYYEAGKISIKEIEQSKEPDCSFLTSLCEEYGLGIKIYRNKIVIYDEEKYEAKPPVDTIKRKGGKVADWEWNTTLQRTYTGAKVVYTDPGNNKKHKAKVGKKGRMLHANISAFSKKDAKLKAKALLRKENKSRTTMSLTVQPSPRYIATATVKLSGFGKASGKYFIETATHDISGDGGYEMTLSLRKVGSK